MYQKSTIQGIKYSLSVRTAPHLQCFQKKVVASQGSKFFKNAVQVVKEGNFVMVCSTS